jgi:hypothetical protein
MMSPALPLPPPAGDEEAAEASTGEAGEEDQQDK